MLRLRSNSPFKSSPLQVKYFLLPLAALLLVSAVLLAPRKPEVLRDTGKITEEQASIELALLYVNSNNPMKGILMLKGLREKFPENLDVVWHLGNFTLKTGQHDKAEAYFNDFIEMAKEDKVKRSAGMILLSDVYAAQGKHPEAVDLLMEAGKMVNDTAMKNAVIHRLNEYLKNN